MGLQTDTVPSLGSGMARLWKAVVKDDDNDLPEWENVIGLRITQAGNVAWIQADGTEIIANFGNFEVVSGSFKRIKSTGTTANGIFALYGTPFV